MPIHTDNHRSRGKRYCPLMKEVCNGGRTKSMKGLLCASWQPVSTINFQSRLTEEIYDCTVFGWTTDLLTEVAQEVSQGAASTDKVASQVAKSRAVFVAALPQVPLERALAIEKRAIEGEPNVDPGLNPKPLQLE